MFALTAAALFLGGCGTPVVAPLAQSESPTLFAEQALEQARKADVSDAQVLVLEQAVVSGAIDIADVIELVQVTLSCIDDGGLTSESDTYVRDDGFVIPGYNFYQGPGLTEEEALAIADRCIEYNSGFVELAYQSQPSAIAAEQAFFERQRPALEACLRDNGVVLDDNVSRDELLVLADELLYRDAIVEVDEEGNIHYSDNHDSDGPPIDCHYLAWESVQ